MIWMSVIMGLLQLLVDYLMKKKKANEPLTDTEKGRLNNLLYRFREIEAPAVELGCIDGGVPEPAQMLTPAKAIPRNPEELRAAIIDGIDRALSLPRFIITPDRAALLNANKAYWQADKGAQLIILLSDLQNLPPS